VSGRRLVLGLLLIGVATTLVWSLLRGTSRPTSRQTSPPTNPSAVSQPPPESDKSSIQTARSQLPGGIYEPSDPRWAEVHAKDKTDPSWEWKMPIDFYGRVIDENEQPVSGAKVKAQWSNLSNKGASDEEVTSNDEGFFSITGKTGRSITIRVSKDGYYTQSRQRIDFEYAAFWDANYYKPDPANPVLFRLRKRNGVEGVITGETIPPLPANGTPVRLDLFEGGAISSQGQLEISATTNTEDYPPRVFDWSATIAVPNGGLVEHNLEFPFQAPEDGYQPSVEFQMWANAPDWRHSVEKNYFIRFGSPSIYGRIRVRFSGSSQNASVIYVVNPTGSRDLEEKEKPKSVPP
jgi:hypothetical protein